MKTAKLLFIGLAMVTISLHGQERSDRFQKAMEEMQAERVSFLTTKLELTVDEAQKFWPVYNEYLKKREELIWGRRERFDHNSKPEEATEEQMKMMLNDMLDKEIKQAQLKKDYYTKIQELLPVKKVLRLQRAEQDFMNHMLNQLRGGEKPGDGKNPNRPSFKGSRGGGF